jgi:hypothetical protein
LLRFFNTDLDTLWTREVPVVAGTHLNATGYSDKGFIMLFFFGEKKVKSNTENFQIVKISTSGDQMEIVRGATTEKGQITGIDLSGNTAVFSVDLPSGFPEIYFVDMSTSEMHKAVINLQDQNFVEEINADDLTGTVDVVVSNYIERKQNMLLLFSYNLKGEILQTYEIETSNESKFLNTAKIMRLGPDTRIIAGTYSPSQDKIPDPKTYEAKGSAGVFITRFDGGNQVYMSYYNFLELDNVKTAYTSKDYYRIQKRSYKESSEFSLEYSLLVHDLFICDSNVCMLVEAYYPDFRTVSDISYDYWGRPIPQTYTVFEGYRYTNGIITSFNEEGELMWDNSLDIYNIVSFDLEKRINYLHDSAVIVLYYNESGQITYKAIRGNISLTGLNHTELDLLLSGDKIVETGSENIRPWYGNYYLCYGYQRIRNTSQGEMERRTVFYLSKVVFE